MNVDELLRDSGIRYFFTDTHGVLFATPRPKFGIYAPIQCPGTNVAALGRDTESSKQVWSAIEGYPGDYQYYIDKSKAISAKLALTAGRDAPEVKGLAASGILGL